MDIISNATITSTAPAPEPTGDFEYSITTTPGTTGDSIRFVATSVAESAGWQPAYFEFEVRDSSDNLVRTQRSINAEVGKPVSIKGVQNAENRIRVRQVDKRLTRLYVRRWVEHPTDETLPLVKVGDVIEQVSKGASATVTGISYWDADATPDPKPYTFGRFSYIAVNNMTGMFFGTSNDDTGSKDIDLTVNGVKVAEMWKESAHPAESPPAEDIVAREWEPVVTLTTSTGPSSVNITTVGGRSTITNGMGLTFVAEAIGFNTDDPDYDLEFAWSVSKAGEAGEYTMLPSDFPFGRDRTTGIGRAFSFTPLTDGVVTISCSVWHPDDYDDRVTETFDVTVVPKATTFIAAETFVVDALGEYTNAPTHAVANRYTSLAQAMLDIADDAEGTFRRLSIRADQTHTLTLSNPFNRPKGWAHLDIDVYDGETTTIQVTEEGKGEIIIFEQMGIGTARGIRVVGPYTADKPDDVSDTPVNGFVVDDCDHVTFDNCFADGVESCFQMNGLETEIVMTNCSGNNYMEFALYCPDLGPQGYAGCYMAQHPRCVRSETKQDKVPPFTANHGPYRNSRPNGARHMSKCYLATASAWAGNLDVQSSIRAFGGMPDERFKFTLTQLLFITGRTEIGPTTNGSMPRPVDMVIDSVIQIAITGSPTLFGIESGGVRAKNVYSIQENMTIENPQGPRVGFQIRCASGNPTLRGLFENEQAPVVVRNCSAISLSTPANIDGTRPFIPTQIVINTDGRQNFERAEFQNMGVHGPDWPEESIDAGPFRTTQLWQPWYPGGRHYDFTVLRVNNGNGADITDDEKTVITGRTSGAVTSAKFMDGIPGAERGWRDKWDVGTGEGVIRTGPPFPSTPFSVGETVDISITDNKGNVTTATATVVSYDIGLNDNVDPIPGSGQTAASCCIYTPLPTNKFITDGLDAGVLLPYYDVLGNVRRRDGTGARGAAEWVSS